MKRKNKDNLAYAVNDEEFNENAQLASKETEEENDIPEKPILTEDEIKRRRARRTKAAVAAFVLLLGIGVMGNWYYENSDFSAGVKPVSRSDTKTLGEAEFVDGTLEQTESTYFSEARVNRQKARDEAEEKLQAVVDSDKSGEAKQAAGEKLAQLSSNISVENKIETLVTAKGCDNCLAVVSEDGKRVDVIVDVQELSDKTIFQIKDAAMKELGCGFEDVTVIQSNN